MARGLCGAYAVSEKYAPLCLLPPTPTPVSGPVVYTDCGDKAWRAPSWGVGVPLQTLSPVLPAFRSLAWGGRMPLTHPDPGFPAVPLDLS